MPDFFPIFRWLLFVFVTIYFCITTIQAVVHWYGMLSRRDRYTGMLRRYLLVQTLRVKLVRFWGDALVCLMLGVVFVLLWYAHVTLEAAYAVLRDVT